MLSESLSLTTVLSICTSIAVAFLSVPQALHPIQQDIATINLVDRKLAAGQHASPALARGGCVDVVIDINALDTYKSESTPEDTPEIRDSWCKKSPLPALLLVSTRPQSQRELR